MPAEHLPDESDLEVLSASLWGQCPYKLKMRWGERFIHGINEVLRKYMASPVGREREWWPTNPAEAGKGAAIIVEWTVGSDYLITRGVVG